MREQDAKVLLDLARKLLADVEKATAWTLGDTSDVNLVQSLEAPRGLRDIRNDILRSAQDIQSRVTGPMEYLEQHQINYQHVCCLRWLLRFNVFSFVPTNQNTISYEQLAQSASVPPARLRSVVRFTITGGILCEPERDQVAHSPLSSALTTDPALASSARFITSYSHPTAVAFAGATAKWGETEKPNETAFNLAFDTDSTFFQYIKETPNAVNQFSDYMKINTRGDAGSVQHLVNGYTWDSLGAGSKIVDIGGSTGHASLVLAEAYPHLTFQVQDLPEVISSLDKSLIGDTERVQFVAHSFLTPQPTTADGVHVFFLRRILHDWPTTKAQEILAHLSAVLHRNRDGTARILVIDRVLPPTTLINVADGAQRDLPVVTPYDEARIRLTDLTMAQVFNGKERELVEWQALFDGVSPPLKMLKWVQPTGSALAIMELGKGI